MNLFCSRIRVWAVTRWSRIFKAVRLPSGGYLFISSLLNWACLKVLEFLVLFLSFDCSIGCRWSFLDGIFLILDTTSIFARLRFLTWVGFFSWWLTLRLFFPCQLVYWCPDFHFIGSGWVHLCGRCLPGESFISEPSFYLTISSFLPNLWDVILFRFLSGCGHFEGSCGFLPWGGCSTSSVCRSGAWVTPRFDGKWRKNLICLLPKI